MGTNGAAGQDGSVFRLYSPNLNLRIDGFQRFADAGEGAAGADAGTESVNGACNLF